MVHRGDINGKVMVMDGGRDGYIMYIIKEFKRLSIDIVWGAHSTCLLRSSTEYYTDVYSPLWSLSLSFSLSLSLTHTHTYTTTNLSYYLPKINVFQVDQQWELLWDIAQTVMVAVQLCESFELNYLLWKAIKTVLWKVCSQRKEHENCIKLVNKWHWSLRHNGEMHAWHMQ